MILRGGYENMKFKKVKDLISYLEQFNPEAEVVTDMMFSWVKPQFQEPSEEDKKTTNILYVYGEYNPYYEQNKNFYKIKDFIIHNYFDKYDDFCSCYLNFNNEEDCVEYYLKHKNYWDYKKTKDIDIEIRKGLNEFCINNGLMEEFQIVSIFITQEVF